MKWGLPKKSQFLPSALCFPLLQEGAERGNAGARAHHDDDGVSGLAGRRKLSLCSHEHPDLGIFRQTVRQIGGGAAASHCAIFLAVAHHADGQVHLFFHLALGGGDGVEAGVRGAAVRSVDRHSREAGKRFSTSTTWALATRGVDLGLVTGQIFERRVVRDLGEASDQAPCNRVSS